MVYGKSFMGIKIQLDKKPKNPVIIEGFPGFGLVGTIATEFLLDHLKTEQIGKIILDDVPAMVAIHAGKVVEPLGIFHNKKYNLVFLHAITPSQNYEWKISDALNSIAKTLKAKEIISLEGVGSSQDSSGEESKAFYFTNDEKRKKSFEKMGVPPLTEGIIIGVTGAILLRIDKVPVSCIFADTHSKLPDSKAAAKIIGVLDKYLGLDVDYEPLLVQAQKFEEKLKTILKKTQETQEISEQKKLNYVG